MFFNRRVSAFAIAILLLCATSNSRADVAEPITADPGQVVASFSLGTVRIDGARTSTGDGSLRVGLPGKFELAGPLAASWAIIRAERGNGLALAMGVTDMWINQKHELLWTPAVALSAKVRTAHSAAMFAAVDFTLLETGFGGTEHPAYLRGALSLMVDMGPYLTWSFGISYQAQVIDGTPPEATHRSGLAGSARVSLVSVRATAFEELPVFSIHLVPKLDLIFLYRLDIDTDTDTNDSRFLSGLRVRL